MRVTYLAHSGFLVELPSVTLLFDWWKGALPPLRREQPLLVFVSHGHEDHFDPHIFPLDDGQREVRFLLGKGIHLGRGSMAKWGVSEATAAKCRLVRGGDDFEAIPGVRVEALRSTDAGVAYLVTADGKTIYHAGDLHWWHWEGEPKADNGTMAAWYLFSALGFYPLCPGKPEYTVSRPYVSAELTLWNGNTLCVSPDGFPISPRSAVAHSELLKGGCLAELVK